MLNFIKNLIGMILIIGCIAFIVAYKMMSDEDYRKQKIKENFKTSVIVCIIALILGCLMNSYYTIDETHRGVVTMFGKVVTTKDAGVHFKIPFVQDVKIIDVSSHGASIGYSIDGSTQTYGNTESPLMITSDFNLINVDLYIEYKVSDPVAFLYNTKDPELVLTNEAMASIRAVVSDYPVDEVMTTAKNEIQQKIKESIQKKLEERNIGLQLINVMIQDVEPPIQEVVNAFKSVETAKQGADTAINNAKKYQSEEIPKAEAEADRIMQEAEATKQARINEAEGQVARFEKMYEEYKKYPLITKKRMFYETMEELLPELEVIISDGNTQTVIPLNGINFNGGVAHE